MNSEVFKALAKGAVLLTATSRLAADWKRRYAGAQPQDACETPGIYSWRGWLQEVARCDERLPLPLAPLQELDLWRQAISADSQGDSQPTASQTLALARQAMRAHALMCDYEIDADELLPGNAEHEAFHRWLLWVRQRLSAMPDRMLAAELPVRLAGLSLFPGRSGILTDGFDAPAPARRRLLAALQDMGAHVHAVRSSRPEASIGLSACEDETHEVQYAAARIAALLEQQPEMRIGVFHPAPADVAMRLSRRLPAALSPASVFDASHAPAALSGVVKRLTDAPLGHLAVFMLSLAGKKRLRFADISALLLSPCIYGFIEERAERARLEVTLRDNNQHTLWLPTAIKREAWQQAPKFVRVLHLLTGWDAAARLPSAWVQQVRAFWWDVFGLNTELEHQEFEIAQINAMGEALAGLVALDRDGGSMAWSDFLAFLRQSLANGEIMRPAASNVSLLSMGEAPGLVFDHVFVLGMDEERWPQVAKPNPFIPAPVQQHAGVPAASPQLAFAESVRLWHHIMHSAPMVEASFARQCRGKEVLASPMLGLESRAAPPVTEAWQPLMPVPEIQAGAFEAVALNGEKIPGGSRGLKEQSACPFRYFAGRRLAISALEETVAGLSARDRGSLVHRALEFIWQRIGNQASLLALLEDHDALQALVRGAVHQAWAGIEHPVERAVRRLESRYLQRLLTEWLRLEGDRPPFTVAECEPWRTWRPDHAGTGRRLHLKLDRVDVDAEGRRLIIDYKTGARSSIGDWLGERPREPQLPLYAVVEAQAGHAPAAVSFARLRGGDMGFEGLASTNVGMPGVRFWQGRGDMPQDWPGLVALWRQRLQALACEMAEGRSEVAPRDERACDYCDLRAVCRIDAMREGVA